MVGEPTLVEPVEKDPTLAASEESEKIGKENDILTTPPDIWSAEYPDGGTRAWLIVFGVSEWPMSCKKTNHSHSVGSVHYLFDVSIISGPNLCGI
jgi:hypothetical protein